MCGRATSETGRRIARSGVAAAHSLLHLSGAQRRGCRKFIGLAERHAAAGVAALFNAAPVGGTAAGLPHIHWAGGAPSCGRGRRIIQCCACRERSGGAAANSLGWRNAKPRPSIPQGRRRVSGGSNPTGGPLNWASCLKNRIIFRHFPGAVSNSAPAEADAGANLQHVIVSSVIVSRWRGSAVPW